MDSNDESPSSAAAHQFNMNKTRKNPRKKRATAAAAPAITVCLGSDLYPPLTDLNYESFISAGEGLGCGFDPKPQDIIRAKTIFCKRRCGASFKMKQEKDKKIIITIKSHRPHCAQKKELMTINHQLLKEQKLFFANAHVAHHLKFKKKNKERERFGCGDDRTPLNKNIKKQKTIYCPNRCGLSFQIQ
jgi:hypothetical protein